MSKQELLAELHRLDPVALREVLDEASRLVSQTDDRAARRKRMRQAAALAVNDYAPGGELTEWTCLDGEDFIDESQTR